MRRAGKWQAERCWLVPTLLHLSSVTHSHTHTHSHTQTPINETEKSFARPPFVSGPPDKKKSDAVWHERAERPPEQYLRKISSPAYLAHNDFQIIHLSHTKQSKINWRLFVYSVVRAHLGDLPILVFSAHTSQQQQESSSCRIYQISESKTIFPFKRNHRQWSRQFCLRGAFLLFIDQFSSLSRFVVQREIEDVNPVIFLVQMRVWNFSKWNLWYALKNYGGFAAGVSMRYIIIVHFAKRSFFYFDLDIFAQPNNKAIFAILKA